jgi:hypothetical protein
LQFIEDRFLDSRAFASFLGAMVADISESRMERQRQQQEEILAAAQEAVTTPSTGRRILNWIQTGLDIIGFILVIGEVADGINAILYLAQGDFLNAGISAAALIPVVGSAATAGRQVYRAVDVATTVARTGNNATNAATTAARTANNASDAAAGVARGGGNVPNTSNAPRPNISDDMPSVTRTTDRSIPRTAEPNSYTFRVNADGEVVQVRRYGPDGRAQFDIDFTNHGNPAAHPHVPHQHDWSWPSGIRGPGMPVPY